MKKINKKTGFTLIELIVSVTIIAVLTVAGVLSYGGASKKARDSRRMSDLYNIKMALELYRQGTGSTYPTSLSSLTTSTPPYLQSIPTGPKGIGDTYNYRLISGYSYVLTTTLEETGLGYTLVNP